MLPSPPSNAGLGFTLTRTRTCSTSIRGKEIVMTDEELAQLIREWAVAKGGIVTDDDFDSLAAVLAEHFLSPETAPLEQARQVLGLPKTE